MWKGFRAKPNAPVSDLIYALRIFVAHKEKSWSRFNETFKDTTVKDD